MVIHVSSLTLHVQMINENEFSNMEQKERLIARKKKAMEMAILNSKSHASFSTVFLAPLLRTLEIQIEQVHMLNMIYKLKCEM